MHLVQQGHILTEFSPDEIAGITNDRFNALYVMNMKENYCVMRWCDNNKVRMVSTVHTGLEIEDDLV